LHLLQGQQTAIAMKKVLSLPPSSHIELMFAPEVWAALNNEFDVTANTETRQKSSEELQECIGDFDAVLTGWGSPRFTPAVLDAAPNLQIVAHTAGTPRAIFNDDVVTDVLIPRGIAVYTGASGIALNVAEITIGLMIMASRRLTQHDAAFHAKKRGGADHPRNARGLLGATVGLVSASLVGRQVMRVLQPFGCDILLYDPLLSPEAARALGVTLVDLDTLFTKSDIVSLHAPNLPATQKMIGAAQLAKMRDGAVLVNTSRGSVVDHDALLAECQSGRIIAALDVTDPEPLPINSGFWDLPNVFLLPHIAGNGREGFLRVGEGAFHALRDCFAGRPIAGAVPLERWEFMA
jgi:phosphoglycerate dehydrogenase-like enzyme